MKLAKSNLLEACFVPNLGSKGKKSMDYIARLTPRACSIAAMLAPRDRCGCGCGCGRSCCLEQGGR